jgi:hypothetical protein
MEIKFHILAGMTLVVAFAAGADMATKSTAPVAARKAVTVYAPAKRVPVKISKSTVRIVTQSKAATPAAARPTATKATPSVAATANNRTKATPRTSAYSAPRQAGPTPDRYREIQDSLIAKGYLEGPATGVWDQNSIAAMKKYQEEQKQDPTGKITAKSLITLGLGPKFEPTTGKP